MSQGFFFMQTASTVQCLGNMTASFILHMLITFTEYQLDLITVQKSCVHDYTFLHDTNFEVWKMADVSVEWLIHTVIQAL